MKRKRTREKEREFFQLQLKSRRDKHTHRSRISRVRLALREEGRFTFDDIYILFTQRYRFIYFTDNLTANRLPTRFFNLFLMLYTLCRCNVLIILLLFDLKQAQTCSNMQNWHALTCTRQILGNVSCSEGNTHSMPTYHLDSPCWTN